MCPVGKAVEGEVKLSREITGAIGFGLGTKVPLCFEDDGCEGFIDLIQFGLISSRCPPDALIFAAKFSNLLSSF